VDERHPSEGVFAAVRRRLWLALLCALIVPAGAYVLSKTVEPEYTASATLLFREPPLQRGFPGVSLIIRDAEARRELLTNVQLASLSVVAERTARRVSGNVSAAQVAQDVDISVNADSDVGTVKARARSGELAARLANAFADEFIAFRRSADVARIHPIQRRTERQIKLLEAKSPLAAALTPKQRRARLQTLRRRAHSLDALAAVQTGRAEVVDPAAAPATPSSPKTKTNVAVGGALGLLLGVSLAFFVDRLDHRLRGPWAAQRALGDLPVIGSIPHSRVLSSKGTQVSLAPMAELEAFRSLRANLTDPGGRDLRSIVITSPRRGDGRTTTAWHLAVAAAETRKRVLLLEADLRQPRLRQMLGFADGRGLVQALASDDDLFGEVQRIELASRIQQANGDVPRAVVDVIPAGQRTADPSHVLSSERMRLLLRTAEERYELVIIDTPPLLAVADAVPLLAQVGGALVVVRIRHTRDSDVVGLAQRLRNLRAHPLGIVVNDSEHSETEAFYAESPAARMAIPALQARNGERDPRDLAA
jgi:succinoglycan biosynthesis transport protein ExoP